MTAGTVVTAPDGSQVTLVDIGQTVLLDNDQVRVWEVVLDPEEVQPWHLHHNPYVVLSLEASPGRMDWLDGSQPRFLDEYVGGAVYRPTSPAHRLTNIGQTRYRNRLIEFKDLGEKLEQPLEIGPGARSVEGVSPDPAEPYGRRLVLEHEHTRVWTVDVRPGETVTLKVAGSPHVVATVLAPALSDDLTGGISYQSGDDLSVTNGTSDVATWFVVELTYLAEHAGEDTA